MFVKFLVKGYAANGDDIEWDSDLAEYEFSDEPFEKPKGYEEKYKGFTAYITDDFGDESSIIMKAWVLAEVESEEWFDSDAGEAWTEEVVCELDTDAGDIWDGYYDAAEFARDPYAYYGLSRSDFF